LSAQVAACGGLVITGGADGIDSAALEGALAAGKPGVAVFGGGVDVIYPKKNTALFDRVLESGCILSEYPPQSAPNAWHFPRRNRILSGISNGVLVVEAPEQSGALNTAEHAFTQGRDVYTVPGNLGVDSCVGSNRLMQRGAFPVITGWDIVRQYETLYPGKVQQVKLPLLQEEKPMQKVASLGRIPGKNPALQENDAKISIDNSKKSTYSVLNERLSRLTEEETSVYALLTEEPQFPDGVMAQSELPAGTVQSLLTKLTLKGLVQNHPGGRISRK
jgi:DNA processing protein